MLKLLVSRRNVAGHSPQRLQHIVPNFLTTWLETPSQVSSMQQSTVSEARKEGNL